MDTKDNGGPAFPANGFEYMSQEHDERIVYLPNAGMTLRDYFAAKAMQAIRTNPDYYTLSVHKVAEAAYGQADAMLEARKQ